MKQKLTLIALCLLLSEYTFSQSVLIDNKGDTLVTITIQQMDKIYIELLQKDFLMAQSEISRFKELKHLQLIDSAKKDISALKMQLNIVSGDYSSLSYAYEKKQKKIKAHRKIGFAMAIIIILQVLLK